MQRAGGPVSGLAGRADLIPGTDWLCLRGQISLWDGPSHANGTAYCCHVLCAFDGRTLRAPRPGTYGDYHQPQRWRSDGTAAIARCTGHSSPGRAPAVGRAIGALWAGVWGVTFRRVERCSVCGFDLVVRRFVEWPASPAT